MPNLSISTESFHLFKNNLFAEALLSTIIPTFADISERNQILNNYGKDN